MQGDDRNLEPFCCSLHELKSVRHLLQSAATVSTCGSADKLSLLGRPCSNPHSALGRAPPPPTLRGGMGSFGGASFISIPINRHLGTVRLPSPMPPPLASRSRRRMRVLRSRVLPTKTAFAPALTLAAHASAAVVSSARIFIGLLLPPLVSGPVHTDLADAIVVFDVGRAGACDG